MLKSIEILPQPELGKTVRVLRKQLGYTQDYVAEFIGVTRQSIVNFESGSTQSMQILQGYLRLFKRDERGGDE